MKLTEETLKVQYEENTNGHQPERPRYVKRNAAYALQPQPPIEYLITDLITSSSVNVFFGEPGSKKTYSMLSLSVCAAAGKPWLGFDIPEPIRVLVIDEESGERRLTVRLGNCLRGELAQEIEPDNLIYISLAGFDLGDMDDCNQLSYLIMDVGAQIVIIDALADIMTGDENSKQETQPVLNHLRKIAEDTDCAILMIHHSNKAGLYRGTSAIKGSVDLMVKVESENESQFINFTTEKNRDGEPQKWAARATWNENQFYLEQYDRKEKALSLTPPRLYVLRYLIAHPDSSIDEIQAGATICSPAAAKAQVYYLAGLPEPYTYRTNPNANTGRGNQAKYSLTPAGILLAKDNME